MFLAIFEMTIRFFQVVFLGTAMAAFLVATRSEFYKHYLGETPTNMVSKGIFYTQSSDACGIVKYSRKRYRIVCLLRYLVSALRNL